MSKRYGIVVTIETRDALKAIAKARGVSMRAVLEEMVAAIPKTDAKARP